MTRRTVGLAALVVGIAGTAVSLWMPWGVVLGTEIDGIEAADTAMSLGRALDVLALAILGFALWGVLALTGLTILVASTGRGGAFIGRRLHVVVGGMGIVLTLVVGGSLIAASATLKFGAVVALLGFASVTIAGVLSWPRPDGTSSEATP